MHNSIDLAYADSDDTGPGYGPGPGPGPGLVLWFILVSYNFELTRNPLIDCPVAEK